MINEVLRDFFHRSMSVWKLLGWSFFYVLRILIVFIVICRKRHNFLDFPYNRFFIAEARSSIWLFGVDFLWFLTCIHPEVHPQKKIQSSKSYHKEAFRWQHNFVAILLIFLNIVKSNQYKYHASDNLRSKCLDLIDLVTKLHRDVALEIDVAVKTLNLCPDGSIHNILRNNCCVWIKTLSSLP